MVWQGDKAPQRGYYQSKLSALYLRLQAAFFIFYPKWRPLVLCYSIRITSSEESKIKRSSDQFQQEIIFLKKYTYYKSDFSLIPLYNFKEFLMNVQNSTTSSSQPKLCDQCQTFYGTQNTNWLCSTCFKKGKKSPNAEVTAQTIKTEPQEVKEPKKQEAKEEKIEVVQVDKKRCFACKKKVGLLGIECKCGFVFCNGHRMPEDHKCEFNFKERGLKQLQKKVVKVENGKIAQI